MERLTDQQWREMRAGAKVLAADEHGEKVLLRPDGMVMKLFRRKRMLSSALWNPYAQRFAVASRRLKLLGFRSARVERVFRVPSIRRDGVVYAMVEGTTLRERIAKHPQEVDALMRELIALMSRLHQAGVYFRAIHMGNVLVCDGQPLGLIDLSEAQFARRGALKAGARARNLRPLRKYVEDAAAIDRFGRDEFVRQYLEQASLEGRQRKAFLRALGRIDGCWLQAP